jgi:hypothetical protein
MASNYSKTLAICDAIYDEEGMESTILKLAECRLLLRLRLTRFTLREILSRSRSFTLIAKVLYSPTLSGVTSSRAFLFGFGESVLYSYHMSQFGLPVASK